MSGYWDISTGEELTDYELETRYDEMLDEVYGTVYVAGYAYETSRALAELDPIAYRVGYSDWLDSELGESITDEEPTEDDDEEELFTVVGEFVYDDKTN